MRPLVALVAAAALVACETQDNGLGAIEGYDELAQHVERNPVGATEDYWIEMQNGIGEWERTGLIFGYLDSYGECLKAIDGMQASNPDRQYRCVPANSVRS